MKRNPTPFSPDPNLDSVLANDIGDNVIESRHFAPSEVLEVIEFEIAADASSGVDILGGAAAQDIPGTYRIIDVIVQAKATSSGGTVTLRKGTTAITDAIAAATDNAIDRAASIDNAQKTIGPADTLNAITNGAADRALVTVLVIKQ